ncbi:hypothetical protein B6U99_05990 [Candidatus Geothermarchaeota archaeon ex4572_27]|nr:MAG: hypothetical protein B6U99_05990 [Candidatus Geothermarchaeota archaeon ex4572_27]
MWVKLVYARDHVPQRPGVYVVRWVRDGKPVRIPRVLAVDEKGILYIGSAGGLRDGVNSLVKGLRRPEHKAHAAALMYHFFGLDKHIKLEEMEVSWATFGSYKEAEEQEWAALKFYADRYGEVPPLNRQLDKKLFHVHVLGLADILPAPLPKLDSRLAQLIA